MGHSLTPSRKQKVLTVSTPRTRTRLWLSKLTPWSTSGTTHSTRHARKESTCRPSSTSSRPRTWPRKIQKLAHFSNELMVRSSSPRAGNLQTWWQKWTDREKLELLEDTDFYYLLVANTSDVIKSHH